MSDAKTSVLIDKMLAGDRLALARLITRVENRSGPVAEIMRRVHRRTGRAHILGITGPPGAGKSTVVDRLTVLLRAEGASVGIVAVDPSSPFSGGAVLGDRIRMQSHTLDPDVFIRSMATRGSLGGLARATSDVIKLLDAFGKQWILIETVGVGQTELDIVKAADTTVVVVVPESGDTIQTMKAGLLEIADIFVVNKADRPGADNMMTELELMLHLSGRKTGWRPPVLATQANGNVGVDELVAKLHAHRAAQMASDEFAKRRAQYRGYELLEIVEGRIRRQLTRGLREDAQLADYSRRVQAGELDPYTAAGEIFADPKVVASWLAQHP